MHLDDARQLALDLMAQHGLTEKGWRFAWGHGKRQLGAAQVRSRVDPRTGKTSETRIIRLSRHLVRLNDEPEVRDTILHEIAHALAGIHNGHNRVWRETCRRIGAKPERLAGESVAVVPARYVLICTCCERVLGNRHRRMPIARLRRTYCKHCGPRSQGKLRHALAAHTPQPDAEGG